MWRSCAKVKWRGAKWRWRENGKNGALVRWRKDYKKRPMSRWRKPKTVTRAQNCLVVALHMSIEK